MPSMKAVRVHEFGSANVLRIERIEQPEPRKGEALVKIMAASVNPVDWKTRNGDYAPVTDEDLPLVPGRDIAGEVTVLGSGVSGCLLATAFLRSWMQGMVATRNMSRFQPRNLSPCQRALASTRRPPFRLPA